MGAGRHVCSVRAPQRITRAAAASPHRAGSRCAWCPTPGGAGRRRGGARRCRRRCGTPRGS
eukprot:6810958-Prymnesium_polylepis.2